MLKIFQIHRQVGHHDLENPINQIFDYNLSKNNMHKIKKMNKLICLFFILFSVFSLKAQNLSPIKLLRAEENYSKLLQNDSLRNSSFLNKLKAIPLSNDKSVYLSLGGEYRPRWEYTENKNWSAKDIADESYYSQRIMFHSDLHLGKHIRFFWQLTHGLVSLDEPVYVQSDELDLHQGFVEFNLPIKETNLKLRVGRQELLLGSGRLVDVREGPNSRRSFDMIRLMVENKKLISNVFYGSEVKVPTGFFDNNSSDAPYTWGLSFMANTNKILGYTALYYAGFDAKLVKYNAGINPETRHTIGLRRFGNFGKRFSYNTEINYQFGAFGDKNISAFSIEGDWHYKLSGTKFRPDFGIKLDYISGDNDANDGKLGTFNPYFNNPAYFGLIVQMAAMNMFDIHPSVKLNVTEKLSATAEADIYWRAQVNDGLYNGGKFLTRASNNNKSRFIGRQSGLIINYQMSRNIKISNATYLFVAGDFIKETGDSKNTIFSALTIWFGF